MNTETVAHSAEPKQSLVHRWQKFSSHAISRTSQCHLEHHAEGESKLRFGSIEARALI